MDINTLQKEIEQKIKEAEEYLPILLNYFYEYIKENEGLNITCRIKSKKRIMEKVRRRMAKSDNKETDPKQLLDWLGDIIGITIILPDETLSENIVYSHAIKIKNHIESLSPSVKFNKFSDYISNPSLTGYIFYNLWFDSEEGIPFEVQITNLENLLIREKTHDKYEGKKYWYERNPVNDEDKHTL